VNGIDEQLEIAKRISNRCRCVSEKINKRSKDHHDTIQSLLYKYVVSPEDVTAINESNVLMQNALGEISEVIGEYGEQLGRLGKAVDDEVTELRGDMERYMERHP